MVAQLRPVRVEETVWIEMPDGCRLAARILLPEDAAADPVPAVLEFLPYRRRDFTRLRDDAQHGWLAARGYAGVRVDMRGTGDSEGLTHGEYLQQELDDAVAIIDWIAAQPWCTGKLGMTGISWGGFNALQVAALRPAPLKAVITACSTDDRYADDIHWMGGCLIADNLNWSGTMLAFNSRPPDPEVVGERWRGMWHERLEGLRPWILDWLAHQRRDAYWKHGSVCEDPRAIEAAVYAVGGWADGYSNAIPRMLSRLTCPRKGLIGPWAHCWPNLGRPGPKIGFMAEALRWWDHWLKGIDTGIMDEPMLTAWMQSHMPPAHNYAERPGRWVSETAWPSAAIAPRAWHLTATGLLPEPGPRATLSARTPQTVGIPGGEWLSYGDDGELPLDQRVADGHSLAFDSAPLDAPLEILGAPEVELLLSVDRPVAALSVRLNDVAPDGAATRITYGLLNLTHDAAHETVTPVAPGREMRVRVALNDIAHAFPEGHRLRISVSTTCWPLLWPSPEPVTLSVVAGESRLTLPVRDPARGGPPPEFVAPDAGAASPVTVHRPPQRGRRMAADAVSGRVEVEALKDRGRITQEAIGLTLEAVNADSYEITGDDPLSARQTCRHTMAMERGDWRIRTETESVMTATATEFRIEARLRAFEGEREVASRDWSETFPRDGI